jgi:hypothetical protein
MDEKPEPTRMYLWRVLIKLYGVIALKNSTTLPALITFLVKPIASYILNTPNLVSSIGAFNAAAIAKPTVIRVCAGSIIPSSHKRPLA